MKASDATTIAKRLGCSHVDRNRDAIQIPGLPNPTQDVSCTLAGVDIDVSVWASHAEFERAYGPAGRAVLCGHFKGFGVIGDQYVVNGDDFSVNASTTPADGGVSVSTLAEAQALSHSLGLPVTTISC